MIDPLLAIVADDPAIGETGELLLTAPPILATQVDHLDAVLYTHTDNDHLGPLTATALMQTGAQFHGPPLVIQELRRLGLAAGQGVSHPPADPATAIPRLRHPERLHILAPGKNMSCSIAVRADEGWTPTSPSYAARASTRLAAR